MYEETKQIACKGYNAYEITYKSQGKKVVGFIVEPEGNDEKLPVIIYNRGGSNNYGIITEKDVQTKLARFASWGYIVFASQYHGCGGSEGKDELGGEDLYSVLDLYKVIKKHTRADEKRIGMFGISRGGLMTYMTLRKVRWVKVAAVIAGSADLVSELAYRPEMKKLNKKMFGGGKEELIKRSAAYWADEIRTHLVLFHNKDDKKVRFPDSLFVYRRAKNAELHAYNGKSHAIEEYEEEVYEIMRNKFSKYL